LERFIPNGNLFGSFATALEGSLPLLILPMPTSLPLSYFNLLVDLKMLKITV